MNSSDELTADVPVGESTVTSTVPDAAADGETAVMDVSEFTVKLLAGLEPNETVLAPVKPVPVTVIVVPPAVGPESGETPVTAGAGGYYLLQSDGQAERAVRDIDIFEAKTVPPAVGRYRQAG